MAPVFYAWCRCTPPGSEGGGDEGVSPEESVIPSALASSAWPLHGLNSQGEQNLLGVVQDRETLSRNNFEKGRSLARPWLLAFVMKGRRSIVGWTQVRQVYLSKEGSNSCLPRQASSCHLLVAHGTGSASIARPDLKHLTVWIMVCCSSQEGCKHHQEFVTLLKIIRKVSNKCENQ